MALHPISYSMLHRGRLQTISLSHPVHSALVLNIKSFGPSKPVLHRLTNLLLLLALIVFATLP
jgi:hypothetical protein